MLPRVQQVMRQTKARIFRGDTRSEGKIVSLFEPSTEVIRKGKAAKPTEFGKLVCDSACNFGSVAKLVLRSGFLWCAEQTRAEQIELGAAVHLALYQLQFCVLSFGLSVRPWLGKSGLHCGPIIDDAGREGGQQCGLCIRNPALQISALAVLDYAMEPVHQISSGHEIRHGTLDDRSHARDRF